MYSIVEFFGQEFGQVFLTSSFVCLPHHNNIISIRQYYTLPTFSPFFSHPVDEALSNGRLNRVGGKTSPCRILEFISKVPDIACSYKLHI